MNWIALRETLPPIRVPVLVSDGQTVAVSQFSPCFEGQPWSEKTAWDAVGFGGYDWEWYFAPTHWAVLPDPPPLEGRK